MVRKHAERELQMWPHLKTYVNAAVKEEIPKPSTRAFDEILEATRDPLTEVKLNAFLSVTKMVTPFLTFYQTDRPMVPFPASDPHNLLKQLLVRFVREDVVESLSLTKLIELDINDINKYKPAAKIEHSLQAPGRISCNCPRNKSMIRPEYDINSMSDM